MLPRTCQAQWELSSLYGEPNLSVWPIEEDAGYHRLVARLIVVFQRQWGVVDVRVQHLDSSVANVCRDDTFSILEPAVQVSSDHGDTALGELKPVWGTPGQ